MKRSASLSIFLVLSLSLFLLFSQGCAKKSVMKEEAAKEEAGAIAQKEGEKVKVEKAPSEPPKTEPVKKVEVEPLEEKVVAKAAPTEAEMKEKAPAAEAVAKEVQFENIHFDFDKYNLKSEAREILKRHAEWLTKNKNYSLVIEGHCDERGTNEYNLALGDRRAKEAMKFLVELGVEAKRIKTISYGEERPLDPGHNEEAWAKNRRAQFVLIPEK